MVLAGQSVAGEAGPAYPQLDVTVPVELQFDRVFDASDPAAETSDLYWTIEPSIGIAFAQWLRFDMGLVFEPLTGPGPGEDRAFEDHGLFVETAQVSAAFGALTVHAGKFSAPFSLAFDHAPGVYGDVLNADIEVAERIGAGAAFNLTGAGAEEGVIVRAAAFHRDTSFLSGSVITARGRTFRSDGGPGNTGDFSNFALALDVIRLPEMPDVHLHLAYLNQSAGTGDATGQDAYVAAANWSKKVSEAAEYQVLAEWAHSDGATGYGCAVSIPGAEQSDLTLAVSGLWHGVWSAAAGLSVRDVTDPLNGDAETRAFHLSAGYAIGENVLAEIAYLAVEDTANGDSQTLGLRLSRTFTVTGR
jgi:hypothetical protein